MPIGTTAVSAKNLPSEPYVITAQAWAQTAKRNEDVITTSQAGPGTPFNFTLPQVGIAAELVITLTATLVIEADHAATTGIRWPYGLLSTFSLGVNGQQNLFDVVGEDLKVRQDIAFPAYTRGRRHLPERDRRGRLHRPDGRHAQALPFVACAPSRPSWSPCPAASTPRARRPRSAVCARWPPWPQ